MLMIMLISITKWKWKEAILNKDETGKRGSDDFHLLEFNFKCRYTALKKNHLGKEVWRASSLFLQNGNTKQDYQITSVFFFPFCFLRVRKALILVGSPAQWTLLST